MKRLELRNYPYAIVRKNKNSTPGNEDECIVYISTDLEEVKDHQQQYYQNHEWLDVEYSIIEIWGNNMCPVIEFSPSDVTVIK